MTNRQWLMKEIQNMSDEELVQQILCKFDICKSQLLGLDEYSCTVQSGKCKECYIAWLNQEHKEPIKLSDAERVILENVDKDYEWVARDENGSLWLFLEKPTKIKHIWQACGVRMHGFKNLFQFIKWEDANPYNIEELLKESQKGNANKYLTIEEIKTLYEEMDNNREAGDSYFTKYDGTLIPLDTGYAFEGIKLFIEEIEHKLKGE